MKVPIDSPERVNACQMCNFFNVCNFEGGETAELCVDSLRRVVRGQGNERCVFGVRENLGITREMSVSSGFDYECILSVSLL